MFAFKKFWNTIVMYTLTKTKHYARVNRYAAESSARIRTVIFVSYGINKKRGMKHEIQISWLTDDQAFRN